MPSIRVRSSAYSILSDHAPENNEAPLIVANEDATRPRPRLTRPSLPTLQILTSPEQRQTIPQRPRSSTVSGRIHAHCTQGTVRSSRTLRGVDERSQSPDNESFYTPTASSMILRRPTSTVTIGAQSNIILSPSSGPGLIENNLNRPQVQTGTQNALLSYSNLHHDDIVEHLDVIDSQIGAVSNLTNAANSIVIPPLSWYSRKPVIVLSPRSPNQDINEEQFPNNLEDALDRHVDDVLKRPSKFRRTMLGVWSFLKTPMGIITGIYGFLVVFWGAAIVVFLAKIINFHNENTQGFWVEVSSQVETGLFTITSIGLIPSRILDTYRIYWIWYYKRKTMKLRKKAGLPQLFDVDDLPDPEFDPNYVHLLTEEEQAKLHRQQVKFQKHQTWYRAHGTETHRAFPIDTALWICLLNDGNSIFQIFLCGTMWGLNRFQRPAWTTGSLIPASFLCGIGAAVLIWRGGEKTKRVEQVKERLRAALEAEKPSSEMPIAQSLSTGDIGLPQSIGRRLYSDSREKTLPPMNDTSSIVDEHMVVPSTTERRRVS